VGTHERENGGPDPGGADDCRALYDAHAPRVMAYLRRTGFSQADGEDLCQETFIRAFKSLATFNADRGSMGQWLGAIARNVARRHWARRTETNSFDPALADELFAAPAPAGESPEAREETAAVGACVESLPPDLAKLVRLRYVEGLTTRAVAERANMPEATVRLRLAQAMEALQRCLAAKGVLE
jgi:RNA polymerase sigma-70 factor (ECF subfamily)